MKSLSGKTSNLMILLVIIIISIFILKQGIAIAQNESNITGYEIANIITSNLTDNFNITNETFSNLTQNISVNESLENITNNETVVNETLIINETSNETSQENFTINETEILNETNETFIEPEIPIEEPVFDIKLNYPQKITRGEILNIKAEIKISNSSARNVVLKWVLPNSFDIISGNEKEFCGDLDIDEPCYSEISVKTDFSTVLGLNEIKVVVSYET